MRESFRTAFLLALALALAGLLATAASAQFRDFAGTIQKVSKKELMVDNRMGDKLKFKPADDVKVSGEGKDAWDQLKKGDWVSVSWKMMDKPRIAYEVKVTPPREEAGEDL
jgi:hypothetical protein